MSFNLQDRVSAPSMSCLPTAVDDFWALLWEDFLRQRRYRDHLGFWGDWEWVG